MQLMLSCQRGEEIRFSYEQDIDALALHLQRFILLFLLFGVSTSKATILPIKLYLHGHRSLRRAML
jgi:hypothetical protein